jgi:hypothetical protein
MTIDEALTVKILLQQLIINKAHYVASDII